MSVEATFHPDAYNPGTQMRQVSEAYDLTQLLLLVLTQDARLVTRDWFCRVSLFVLGSLGLVRNPTYFLFRPYGLLGLLFNHDCGAAFGAGQKIALCLGGTFHQIREAAGIALATHRAIP
jgi:hypothetical protein